MGVVTAARAWLRSVRSRRALFVVLAVALSPANPTHAEPGRLPPKDAGPLRTDSALTEVQEHMRNRDIDGALAAIDALAPQFAKRPGMRYLKARLYGEKERIHDALDVLPDDLSALPPLVARDIQARRALWLARTGRCSEAKPMLIVLSRYDGPDAELALRGADCAVVQSDPVSALVMLQDIRGAGSRRFGVRFTLAKLLATTGDTTAAVRMLKTLYVEFPNHSRIGDVEAQLRELVPDWTPSNEEHFDRAAHWLSAAQPEAALAELEKVQVPPNKPRGKRERREYQQLQARILHLRGMSLFRMRTRYPDAARVLNQAANLGGPTQTSDAYRAAQALARADRDAEAVRAYRVFAKRFPRDSLSSDALHGAAWLELRHNLPGGEAHMRELLRKAERRGAKTTVMESVWDLATHAFATKHCDRGLPLFERYATLSQTAMIKARGLYWAGRCAVLIGKRELALKHFRDALGVEPLHWYALLARSQIAALGEDPGPPFGNTGTTPTTPPPVPPASTPALPPVVAFYADLGLMDDAITALRHHESALREGRDDDGLPLLVAAYHSLNEYTRPYLLAARERNDVMMRVPQPGTQAIWQALFPKPFAREVAFAADASKLPPELVFAVIRKESAYNPSVVSSADAIGLMQLIERTAKLNAQEMGIKRFERSMLYDPGTNVMLGSHYLSKLIARYHGQAVPAIAAYNAGEHRVDPWLKRNARDDKTVELDWFVEDIPIEQTRNYVRRVVCNWARYKYLEDPKGWPLEVPLTLSL